MPALLRALFATLRKLRRAPRAAPARADLPSDPWLAAILGALGERYRLGAPGNDGVQVLRRTARERFNLYRVYLATGGCLVTGYYEAHARPPHGEGDARALLAKRVDGPLAALGLAPTGDTVEAWAGQVVTRRYSGRFDDAGAAAEAVRYLCQESEQVLDTAAED